VFVRREEVAMDGTSPVKVVAGIALLGALLLAACAVQVALADDSSVGAIGGTAYPIWTTDIRLAAETVQATCFGSFAEYRVDFRFVNDGRARKVKLGFPFTDTVTAVKGTERPFGFQAWQDGRPLAVRAVPGRHANGRPTAGYYVHVAFFRPGATTITVSYLAQRSGEARERALPSEPGDPDPGSPGWYTYWLHTGSTWKGTIGEALVRYRLADTFQGSDIGLTEKDVYEGVSVTTPPGWTRPLPRAYQWRFVDFEPTPMGASGWWDAQSSYDVTLAFTDLFEPRDPLQAKWTSSSVAGGGEGSWTPSSLQDGSLQTCWAEGATGAGEGEWVEATFKRPVRLRELRLLPGNNAYPSAFARYARPKRLTAVFSDGSSVVLSLRDAPSLQRFPVDVTTSSVRFVTDSVYPGTDYAAACIGEVEFGTRLAPGYASFARLMEDDAATGRLPSWAGPPAPTPEMRSRAAEWAEGSDAEWVAEGDLIGVDLYEAFPYDHAPFKEAATLGDVTTEGHHVTLPEEEMTGEATGVTALSYWTFAIRYDSGVDLLVNTRVSGVPHKSVLDELAFEKGNFYETYEDGRALPYEVRTIGTAVVGVARPGTIVSDCSGSSPDPSYPRDLPAQVFWQSGDTSYHLYARSAKVATDELVEIATWMIDPRLLPEEEPALGSTARGWLVTLGAIVAAALFVLVVVLRRRPRGGHPASAV
jgi:hypothetical protein